MTYHVMNLLTDRNSINAGGYRISQIPNYTVAVVHMYRPEDRGMNPSPMSYGTHVHTVDVEWVGDGDEPNSVLLNDDPTPGVYDLLALNNLVAREAACLQGDEERAWHVPFLGGVSTLHPGSLKQRHLTQALDRVRRCPPNAINSAWMRSLLWLMESWKHPTGDVKIIVLRSAFELLWKHDDAGVQAGLTRIQTMLGQHTTSQNVRRQVAARNPLHFLVVGRQVRNFATHSGGFLGNQQNEANETIEQAVVREMIGPTRRWQDGDPSLATEFQAKMQAYGPQPVLVSSIVALDALLYCLMIDWLGIGLSQISLSTVNDFAQYFVDFVWPSA